MASRSNWARGSLRRVLAGPVLNLLLVAFGTTLVVGSGVGVYAILQTVPGVHPVETRQVMIVAREVNEKQPISPDALRLAEMPAELAPASAVQSPTEVEGKVAATRLMPGETLLRHRLMDPPPDNPLAAQLGPDEVAITFPAVGIASVGSLMPGDRVDILITLPGMPLEPGQPARGAVTAVALQDQKVLSVTKGLTQSRAASALTRAGALGSIPSAGESAGQVIIAAAYEDALFLKALKDAGNVGIDLVLRPAGTQQLMPAADMTLLDGLQRRWSRPSERSK